MVVLKYFGVLICVVGAISEVLPIYLIGKGLWVGQVEDVSHFTMKLALHVVFLLGFCFVAYKLLKNVKASKGMS